MKPLSEFAEALRKQKSHTYASENGDYYRGFDVGVAHAVALLQAWLREADRELSKPDNEYPLSVSITSWPWPGSDSGVNVSRDFIREKLLGTTQKRKQEGEK